MSMGFWKHPNFFSYLTSLHALFLATLEEVGLLKQTMYKKLFVLNRVSQKLLFFWKCNTEYENMRPCNVKEIDECSIRNNSLRGLQWRHKNFIEIEIFDGKAISTFSQLPLHLNVPYHTFEYRNSMTSSNSGPKATKNSGKSLEKDKFRQMENVRT